MNAPRMVLAGIAAVAIAGAPATAAGPRVVLKHISFTPSALTVQKGTTVTWSWQDGVTAHNVTSRGSQKFKTSPTQMTGTWQVRFMRAGTYRYVCTLHPGMTGKVVVR